MDACPRCGGESPPVSQHCVHCGYRLHDDPSHHTAFGMSQINPLGPNAAAGSSTTQFGADDLARLAAVAREEGLNEPDATPVSSLLAGLPRPRVSSTPSPLTTGGDPFREATPERAEKPSARSTVMGMPVLQRAQLLTKKAAAPQAVEMSAPSAGPSIQSLDSFDINAPAPQPAPAPAPAPAAEPTPKPARSRHERDTHPVPVVAPPVQAAAPAQASTPSEAPAGNGGLWALIALVVVGAGVAAWYLLR